MKLVYLGKDGTCTFTFPEAGEYVQVIGYAENGQLIPLSVYGHQNTSPQSEKEDKQETWRDRPSLL